MLTLFRTKKTFYRPNENLQIFDLLQLSRKERECKSACIDTIQKLDVWKKRRLHANGSSMQLYRELEGLLLRRQAQDAVLFYKLIRKDRMRAFHDYTENLPPRNSILGVVS